MKKKLKPWGLSLGAVIVTCLYPCVFMFCQNAGEAAAGDMLPFFLIFLATAGVGLALSGGVFRDISRGGFFTCLGMLVVMNFAMVTRWLRSVLPWVRDKYVLAVILLIGLGLMVLLLRKKPNMTAGCGIFLLTFGVLIGMSAITAVPKLIQTASYDTPNRTLQTGDVTLSGEKRNVYYLLFDEYGGDENLMTYFDFDNSAFYQALAQRGFSISHTSYNTESCWTDTLVPNLLNLDYVTNDDMPEKIRREYLKEPLLTELFLARGYQVNLINHRDYLRMADANELTQGQTEDNISEYLFENSIFYKIPWTYEKINRWLFEEYRDHYTGPLENALTAMVSCADAAQDAPTLTVSYIQCPHAPFVYNKDGSVRDLHNAWYWLDNTLYPGQLEYLNTLILQTIDNIQEKDPEAVILLLSDHGARVPLHLVEQYGGPRFDAAAETPVMQSTLCCAYLPGQTIDIAGKTCINATRTVLNAAFDTDLPEIPAAEGYVLDESVNAAPHPDPAETPEAVSETPTVSPSPSPSPSPSYPPPPPPQRDGKGGKDGKGGRPAPSLS